MPTMNQEKADELKYKIESLFEEYANFGDIKFKVSINYLIQNFNVDEIIQIYPVGFYDT